MHKETWFIMFGPRDKPASTDQNNRGLSLCLIYKKKKKERKKETWKQTNMTERTQNAFRKREFWGDKKNQGSIYKSFREVAPVHHKHWLQGAQVTSEVLPTLK